MKHPATRATRILWSPLVVMVFLGGPACDRRALVDGLPTKLDCSSCHGGRDNAAPPRAVNGETSTTNVGVGAHQAHLKKGSIAGPVACTECHVVPAEMDLEKHPAAIPAPATMTFGPLARTQGAKPAWNHDSATCSNTYCHGATLGGTAAPTPPVWTTVDGSQIQCKSCHAYSIKDLDGSHPSHKKYTCDTCHAEVTSDGTTILAPDLHVNGRTDVSMAEGTWNPVDKTCSDTACHDPGAIAW
jgi:predicted CxxxxCH...CXXCH cytochrome family protein